MKLLFPPTLGLWAATASAAGIAAAFSLATPPKPAPLGVSPKADFVFIIDATGSMSDEITAVKNGLSGFVTGLQDENIDARFSIVLFGDEPELVLDFTTSLATTTAAFNQISTSGAVAGFQNNHNINPEAGLEAIRVVLGASTEVLAHNNVGGTGVLAFRPDAVKNLILVTDEDSDRPFHASNQFPGQTTNEPPSPLNAAWQAEVNATAAAVIQNNAFINMLVNTSDPPTTQQYGQPTASVSDPDFLNYDPAATLANLQAASLGSCLEAQVLAAGLIGRAFNITQVNTPNFINNFFAAKIEEVVEANIPPVFTDGSEYACSTAPSLSIQVGVPFPLVVKADSPELDQTTTMTVDAGGFGGLSVVFTPGSTATANCILTASPADLGQSFTLKFKATDNGTPNLSSELQICFRVDEGPLSIELAKLMARPAPGGGAAILWATASETDTVGFNLYRSTNPRKSSAVKVNDAMILSVGGPTQGAEYEFLDALPVTGTTNFYWLEDVDLHGISTFHGPILFVTPQ
ncbi:MAG: VWA domain-containing protein [Planctomycetes bacterium]|nr:VWA domain-containing protein [Planctomycetota bacterium]